MKARDKNDNTALLKASFAGHLPVVQWLLETNSASIIERNEDGDTALLLAAFCGHLL